jgi:serine phosphatase RsbU (regulator of sigma subunit)
MTSLGSDDLLTSLTDELANFQEMARCLLPQPGEIPRLHGVDVFGGTVSLNGVVGGDHIVYVDFKRRFDLEARIGQARLAGRTEVVENLLGCRHIAGVALMDVSGHRVTDALLAAMLHQAFLVGAMYELDIAGRITRRLFETLNTRFFESSGAHKYVSLIYGEIGEDARFRFLSAGHPPPVVFSRRHDCLMEVDERFRRSFPPVGLMPSLHVIDRGAAPAHPLGFKDRYEMNHWHLMGAGDILVLHTDGVSEHTGADGAYFPVSFEKSLRRLKDRTAREIYDGLIDDLLAHGPAADDISLVVIKLAH